MYFHHLVLSFQRWRRNKIESNSMIEKHSNIKSAPLYDCDFIVGNAGEKSMCKMFECRVAKPTSISK